jgi:hypothetical protein
MSQVRVGKKTSPGSACVSRGCSSTENPPGAGGTISKMSRIAAAASGQRDVGRDMVLSFGMGGLDRVRRCRFMIRSPLITSSEDALKSALVNGLNRPFRERRQGQREAVVIPADRPAAATPASAGNRRRRIENQKLEKL